jgi:putative acetyltransferase
LYAANKAAPSLVAVSGGKVVGHVVFSPMEIDPPRPALTVVAMGPVGVLPEYQRRGIGSQLVRAGIDACRDAGVDVVAVLGAPRFYGRFGFQAATGYGLTNEYVQDEHFMIRELRRGSLQGVTGLLSYAPEFREAGC